MEERENALCCARHCRCRHHVRGHRNRTDTSRHRRDDGEIPRSGDRNLRAQQAPGRHDHVPSRAHGTLRAWRNLSRQHGLRSPARRNVVGGDTAVKDIGTVVDFILARRNIPRLNLIGWSWGTVTMSTYTTQNPGKVERLVLYAPGWIRQTASLVQAGPGPLGAYRKVTREQAMQRWMTGVPDDKKATLIPAGWFDAWADATWATDPEGAKANPPYIRAPNGVIQDSQDYWAAGKAYYDPAKITVPTLLVQAEWDRDLPPYMAQTLFPLLVNSPGKRYVMLAEGTHTISMEKNRLQLFEAVQAFLDEAGRS